jgi:hypothetical protein
MQEIKLQDENQTYSWTSFRRTEENHNGGRLLWIATNAADADNGGRLSISDGSQSLSQQD